MDLSPHSDYMGLSESEDPDFGCNFHSESPSPSPQTVARSEAVRSKLRIQYALGKILAKVHDHPFATCGFMGCNTLPGIFIHGLGGIGLPLSKQDAVAIGNLDQSASIDVGIISPKTSPSEALVLARDRFEQRNDLWQSGVEDTVNQVALELGLQAGGRGPLRPELSALCLRTPHSLRAGKPELFPLTSAEEATFDNGKTSSRKVAMLMIVLPSEHLGGDIMVEYQEEEKIMATAQGSAYGFQYVAW